jgi:uncharacterized small protein (DUF1192 family)
VILRDRTRVDVVAEQYGLDAFRNPLYREIFGALLGRDSDAPLEDLAASLTDAAARVMDSLLGEPLVPDADIVFAGALDQLKVRDLDEQIAALQADIELADGEAKDALIARKRTLSNERQALGGRQFKVGRANPSNTRPGQR